MSEFKTAAHYIETVYGTRTFARALDCNDAMSIMDLMQDFSDYNLKQSNAPQMLEMLKSLVRLCDSVELRGQTVDRAKQLIQQATTI